MNEFANWDDIPKELWEAFATNKYSSLRFIRGQGLCALCPQIFVVDLITNIDSCGYYGRYTFETMGQALKAISSWSGEGEPGNDWINHYGGYEGRIRNLEHPINKGHVFND